MVEADMLLEPARADSVEEAKRAEGIDIGSVLGHVERDFNMGLSAEIVNLRGLDLGEDVDEIGAVGEVAVVELELCRA